MKILITTDLFTTATNGVVTSVKSLVGELENKGHDIKILTISDNTKSRKDGSVYYIRSMPFSIYPDVRMPLSYRHKLIKEIIDWKPDIIHSQCEFFSFQFARRISKITGAPLVHTYHTLYEQYAGYLIPNKRLGKYIVRVFSRKRLKPVNTVIAPTRKVEDVLHSYGVENSISVIPTGIDLSQHQIYISDQERRQKRHELGIDDDKIVLINLGRLGTEKNLDELLDFYAKAVAKNDKLMFLIVGDGPAKEGLEKLSEELGVSDSVIFTGMVDPQKVQEYYQLGDVFVSASTSETQGLTYVEAAANGLPLLCRQDDCLKDVIRQGKSGYEYTDIEEFLTDIEVIANDTEWRNAASKYNREIATTFDKHSFGDAIEALYKSVL